ncbi:MAG: YgiT-type zinc finger protein [Chloroflexi bacterium]|nr:YgiT-type zinc finger protein [Chloroflexota bacterium]
MSMQSSEESLVERKVTYTLEQNGKLIVIENVPARINLETGDQLFAPETVERLQNMIWEEKKPTRVMQVPVFEFS